MSKLLYCWNHIFRDVRLWCRKHGAPTSDITVYVDDVQQLFHSMNEKDYQKNLLSRSEIWDSAFKSYYMSEIHPDVCQCIGRWVLEEYKLYNPYSGITNNQSEGFNRFV